MLFCTGEVFYNTVINSIIYLFEFFMSSRRGRSQGISKNTTKIVNIYSQHKVSVILILIFLTSCISYYLLFPSHFSTKIPIFNNSTSVNYISEQFALMSPVFTSRLAIVTTTISPPVSYAHHNMHERQVILPPVPLLTLFTPTHFFPNQHCIWVGCQE